MKHRKPKPPIIIMGCPRSGTLLVSRVLGTPQDHFLITEHSNKPRYCPEDHSNTDDSRMWWDHFDWPCWDTGANRPFGEIPIYDKAKIQLMRRKYLSMASGKRLVIKNPTHLPRVNLLREMFPDALFVYVARAPWPTIQSMIVKENHSFLIFTPEVIALKNNLLLQAAATWASSNNIYLENKTTGWSLTKYEDLISAPLTEIKKLYQELGIEDKEALKRATSMPSERERGFSFIKDKIASCEDKTKLIEIVTSTARYFGYDVDIANLPDGAPSNSQKIKKKSLKSVNYVNKSKLATSTKGPKQQSFIRKKINAVFELIKNAAKIE